MRWLSYARVMTRLLAVGVLVASGIYLLLYLYRWEWNRALVSGVFFLAAEVALIGTAIVTRLHAIERRVSTGGVTPPPGEGDDGGRHPFAWLDETSGGFGVFIPILLGAGVILSLLAWVVERMARFVTAPVSGARSISRLAPLDLPPGGLVPEPGEAPPVTAAPGGGGDRTWLNKLGTGVATFLVAVACMLAVWFLREETESRPEAEAGGTTELDLRILTRETGATMPQLVDALWVSCRLRLPATSELAHVNVTGPETASLVLTPALGRTDERQFVGCLEDITIDRVNAWVTRFETFPDRPAA